MKTLHRTGLALALTVSFCAHAALPTNGLVSVGNYVEVSVAGQTNATGLVVSGTLEKRGSGNLTLTDTLALPGTILVQNGTVIIADTGASVALPSSLQSGLAFWVDAATNVVLDGAGKVDKWLDVRETSTNAPYAYMRAEHDYTYYSESPRSRKPSVVQGNAAVNGLPLMDFGTFGATNTSAAWLPWRNADGTRGVLTNIRAVFAVTAFPDSNGFFLEDWDYTDAGGETNTVGSSDFWLGGSVNTKKYYYLFGANFKAGRQAAYINGIQVNGSARVPDVLGQVIEVIASESMTAGNFFNAHNTDGYTGFPDLGGGRIGECLIYTNALTETARVAIEDYLMRKWKKENRVGVVQVAKDGTAVTDVRQGVTNRFTSVSGEGVWRKTGAGTVSLERDLDAMMGPIQLDDGALVDDGTVRHLGRLFDVADRGLVIDAETNRWSVLSTETTNALVKNGAGELTVTGLPSTVKQVIVNNGVLRFTRALQGAEPVEPVAIYNNSFEIFDNHDFHGQWSSAYPDLWGFEPAGSGWTYTGNPTTSSSPSAAGIYMPDGNAAVWCVKQPAPDGQWVAIIKQGGGMATTFGVASPGRYRMVFHAAGRSGYGPHRFDILIDGQVISQVRTTHPLFRRYAYVLPDLAAGTHTLAFQGVDENSDRTSLVDDIRIERIGDSRVEAVVSNGTFEVSNALTESNASYVSNGEDPGNYSFNYAVTNGGWTFVDQRSGISEGFSPWLSQSIAGEGNRSAFIHRDGTLSTTVTFSTNGTYVLSFLTAARPYWSGAAHSPHDFYVKLNGTVILTRVNNNAAFERMELPLAAVTNAPVSAELSFKGINTAGGDRSSLIDDVHIIRQSDDNPVRDGGFEVPAGVLANGDTWDSGVTNTAWTFNTDWASSGITRNNSVWGNPVAPEGACAGFLRMGYRMSQSVTFDEGGYYTLSFMAAGRLRDLPSYCLHDFRVLFNGETVGTVQTFDDTWRRYTFRLPYVKRGGAGLLAFEGVNSMKGLLGMGDDHDSFVDNVRMEKQTPLVDTDRVGVYRDVVVCLASGSRLSLDFSGQVVFKEVWYDGKLCAGVLDASNTSFLTGAGSVYVAPKGTVLSVR